jgi:ChrR-like protein with cupin domain
MTPTVTIVNIADLPLEGVQRGRVNMIRRKRLPLETGVPGVTCEFSLSIVPEGYFTPRHRHNFDQIRYTLTGVQSTGYGDLGPGEIGYFPEGAYYGPQAQKGECSTLVLQFQGASGEHLLSNEEMNATYQKMIAQGAVFQDGIYRGLTADGRRKNKDSYVAIWEEHEAKKLAFPKPRYRAPVMMQPQFYSWLPDRERPGIETKHLGTFNEMRTGMGFFRLLPGARLAAGRQKDAELCYLVEGACSYGAQSCAEGTYLYLPPGAETDTLVSERGATFFYISLPLIAEFAARQQTGGLARAAAE